MEIFGRFWILILSFLLLFIAPFYLMEARRLIIKDIFLISESDRFLDRLRYSGYLEREELNSFMKKIAETGDNRSFSLTHRRRAVKPIFVGNEIQETKEFFFEIPFYEIKEVLKTEGRYIFHVGDEVGLKIDGEEKKLIGLSSKEIVIGGMIENELVED